jgi:tetratricopeptide (TPR) repeat protein
MMLHGEKEYDIAIGDFSQVNDGFFDHKVFRRYLMWGEDCLHKGEYDRAIDCYNKALRIGSQIQGTKKRHDLLYTVYYTQQVHFYRGLARHIMKDYGNAIADYDEVIRLDPSKVNAFYNRAWLQATCPDAKYRDGKKALQTATLACDLTEWEDANSIDVLAAAYAEAGTFDKAVEWQEKAIRLYTDTEDKKKGEERLRLYKERKPYRDTE